MSEEQKPTNVPNADPGRVVDATGTVETTVPGKTVAIDADGFAVGLSEELVEVADPDGDIRFDPAAYAKLIQRPRGRPVGSYGKHFKLTDLMVDDMLNLQATYASDSKIFAALTETWLGITRSAFNRLKELAKDERMRLAGKPKEELLAESAAVYRKVVQDANPDHQIIVAAQGRLDRIYGLDQSGNQRDDSPDLGDPQAPQTGPSNDIRPEQAGSVVDAQVDIAQLSPGTTPPVGKSSTV